MKHLKKYSLLLVALGFIILGAAMPYLTSKIQDAQIGWIQKKAELSTVDLILRPEDDVGPVLKLMSEKNSESLWKWETVLSEEDAGKAAVTVMKTLNDYGLLREEIWPHLEKADIHVQPHLVVGKNGSSALIWVCTWIDAYDTFITLDDTTGKAVRISVQDTTGTGDLWKNMNIRRENWEIFLQDYYDIVLTEVTECNAKEKVKFPAVYNICCSSKKGTIEYELPLRIEASRSYFNFQN